MSKYGYTKIVKAYTMMSTYNIYKVFIKKLGFMVKSCK